MTGKSFGAHLEERIRDRSQIFFRHESKAVGATRLSDIGEEWKFYDVIGVDEGQFFEDVSFDWSNSSAKGSHLERKCGKHGQGRDSGSFGYYMCAHHV